MSYQQPTFINNPFITKEVPVIKEDPKCITNMVMLPFATVIMSDAVNTYLNSKTTRVCNVHHFDELNIVKLPDQTYKFVIPNLLLRIFTSDILKEIFNKIKNHEQVVDTLIGMIKNSYQYYQYCYIQRSGTINYDNILDKTKLTSEQIKSSGLFYSLIAYLITARHVSRTIDNIFKITEECKTSMSYVNLGLFMVEPSMGSLINGHSTMLIFEDHDVEYFDPHGNCASDYIFNVFQRLLSTCFMNRYNFYTQEIECGIQVSTPKGDDLTDYGVCGLYSVYYMFKRGKASNENKHTVAIKNAKFYETNHHSDLLEFATTLFKSCLTTSGNLYDDLCSQPEDKRGFILKEYVRHKDQDEVLKTINMVYSELKSPT